MALLNSIINVDRPKEKPVNFTVSMIHYSKLVPSERNNYSVENIENLAHAILLAGGIKENLTARKKTPGEYELISGHRRRLAAKYITEELGMEGYAMVPVHVENEGDILSEVNLILMNCAGRERSDWEKMMEIARLTELAKAMQTGGETEQERFRNVFGREPGVSGRELRKLVAESLGLSETKVANLSHINNRLIPELKERFKEGDIGVSVANEAAGLPPETQQELAVKEELRIADVKGKKPVSESDTEEKEQIPGQMEIEDFPEYMPEEYAAEKQQSQEGHQEIKAEPEKSGKCIWREGFFCTLEEAQKVAAGDGENCNAHCCWNCPKHGDCGYECNSSAHRQKTTIRWNIGNEYGTRSKYCDAAARKFISCFGDWMLEDIHSRMSNVTLSEIEFKREFRMNGSCTWYFPDPEDGVAHVNLFDDYIQFFNGEGQWVGNCEWFYLCASVQSMWNTVSMEQTAASHCAEGPQGVNGTEPDEADATDAQFEEMPEIVPEPKNYDRSLLQELIQKKVEELEMMGDYWGKEQPEIFTKRKMALDAYQMLLESHEHEEEEPIGQKQPELPLLKNSGQRKAWLRDYRSWGLWYEDKNIGVRYYRYQFDNGAVLIAEEYENHDRYVGDYVSSYLHLVGGPEPPKHPPYGYGKWTRHECYNRHPNSETELVEFLKEIQTKG